MSQARSGPIRGDQRNSTVLPKDGEEVPDDSCVMALLLEAAHSAQAAHATFGGARWNTTPPAHLDEGERNRLAFRYTELTCTDLGCKKHGSVKDLAWAFGVDPKTVWRIYQAVRHGRTVRKKRRLETKVKLLDIPAYHLALIEIVEKQKVRPSQLHPPAVAKPGPTPPHRACRARCPRNGWQSCSKKPLA